MRNPKYTRFDNLALRLIQNEFDQGGFKVVINAVTPNPDPTRPPTAVVSTQDVPAVARGISAQLASMDPNLTTASLQVLVARLSGYAPVAGEHVQINGRDTVIVRVEPIPASGLPCAYRFFVN